VLAADSGPKFCGDSGDGGTTGGAAGGATIGKLDFGWRKKGNVGAGCLKVYQFVGFKNVSIAI
jgi:hypothetical protein